MTRPFFPLTLKCRLSHPRVRRQLCLGLGNETADYCVQGGKLGERTHVVPLGRTRRPTRTPAADVEGAGVQARGCGMPPAGAKRLGTGRLRVSGGSAFAYRRERARAGSFGEFTPLGRPPRMAPTQGQSNLLLTAGIDADRQSAIAHTCVSYNLSPAPPSSFSIPD
jgi:hypothetical protein